MRAVASRIEHSGVVERAERDTVYVRITSHSACGSCKAREACGLKSPDAAHYAAGEKVMVGVRRSAGAVAVILAYVGALAVLLAVLVAAVALLGWSEGRGALAALGAVVVYYCILWLFRHKIEHTIHFSITKHY
mgnify:CR=1 FL=1